MSDITIARLRAEYADLHRDVLDRLAGGEDEFGAPIQREMVREMEIVDALKRLGVTPDGEVLRDERFSLREARAQ